MITHEMKKVNNQLYNFDSSGNGRTGTINGNPLWAPGKYGAGLKMDGTGDDIQVSDF